MTAYYPELESSPRNTAIISEIAGKGKHIIYWATSDNDQVNGILKSLKIRPSRMEQHSPDEWHGLIKDRPFWFAIVTSKSMDKLIQSGHACHAIND